MTHSPADKNQLQIRCPSCSQKFKVGTELMGRMVECGACESRFEVGEEVLVKGAKFYPGERDPKGLGHFQRVPGPTLGTPAYVPAAPGPQNEKGYYSPITRVTPFRVAVGWLGALLIFGLSAFLLVGSAQLAKVPVGVQVIGAIAGGITGIMLLIYANPRTWRRTLPVVSIGAVILLVLPFVFRSKQSSAGADEHRLPAEAQPVIIDPETSNGLRDRIGIAPLETEIRRMADGGDKRHAFGIWLRDLSESNRLAVRDYLMRATGANPTVGIYPRDNREFLMVLTGVDMTLDELAAVTRSFARQQKTHPEINVIETQVDGSVFVEGPLDKLTDRANPAFYDLNKRELESIQIDRVSRAVVRLADAEPKIYRDDITRLLIALVGVEQVDFSGNICRALLVWADKPATAAGAVFDRLTRLTKQKKKIPKEMVALLAKAKYAAALPIIEGLWLSEPTAWEQSLGDFGQIAEPGILAHFPKLEGTLRHSAARLLARVGTKASLPVMEAARSHAEPELVVLIDNAVKAINQR